MELLRHQMANILRVRSCVLAKNSRVAAYVYFPRVPRIYHERRELLPRNVCSYVFCMELYGRTYIQCAFGVWCISLDSASGDEFSSLVHINRT